MRVCRCDLEDLQRRVPIVRRAWPGVEAVGDGIEFVLHVDRRIGALGQVLAPLALWTFAAIVG